MISENKKFALHEDIKLTNSEIYTIVQVLNTRVNRDRNFFEFDHYDMDSGEHMEPEEGRIPNETYYSGNTVYNMRLANYDDIKGIRVEWLIKYDEIYGKWLYPITFAGFSVSPDSVGDNIFYGAPLDANNEDMLNSFASKVRINGLKNENKQNNKMAKKIIRITESQLRDMVTESIKRILREDDKDASFRDRDKEDEKNLKYIDIDSDETQAAKKAAEEDMGHLIDDDDDEAFKIDEADETAEDDRYDAIDGLNTEIKMHLRDAREIAQSGDNSAATRRVSQEPYFKSQFDSIRTKDLIKIVYRNTDSHVCQSRDEAIEYIAWLIGWNIIDGEEN